MEDITDADYAHANKQNLGEEKLYIIFSWCFWELLKNLP